MNIVITAGGTSEYVDKVRKITNSSTGKLGSIIANKILESKNISNLYYITTKKSIKPKCIDDIRLHIIEIETTLELKDVVEKVLKKHKIDVFIHSMAVSDYMIDYVTTAQMLTNEIDKSDDTLKSILENKNVLDNTSKISSGEDNLIIKLVQTPKIINLIKKISPKTLLIGFKLLENVSEKELIDVGYNLLVKNNCDYVLANDLSYIKSGYHKGFLINKNKKTEMGLNKDEIAELIVSKIKRAGR